MMYERPLRTGDHVVEIKKRKHGVDVYSSYFDEQNPQKEPDLNTPEYNFYLSTVIENAALKISSGLMMASQRVISVASFLCSVGMLVDSAIGRLPVEEGLAASSLMIAVGAISLSLEKTAKKDYKYHKNVGQALSNARKSENPTYRQVFPADPNLFY